MDKKKILYIDMDGVVADFDKGILQIYPDYKNTHHTSLEWPIRHMKVLKVIKNDPLFFLKLESISGAIDAVNELFASDKYDIYFLSTPMWNVPHSFLQKKIWIQKHFGMKARKRLILTYRKDLNKGDYLIDDTTRNGAGEFEGEHLHFGTEKYPDWKSVLKKLL